MFALFGPYNIGNSLYPLALDLFIPTIFLFFFGSAYRTFRYFAVYHKPFVVYTTTIRGNTSLVKKSKLLFNTFANSSKVGIKKKPITTGVGLLMHLSLIVIIFLLAQHMVFWAYYIPPYKVLFPLAIPESSTDGLLALANGLSPLTPTPYPFVHDLWGPLTVILNGQYITYLLMILLGIYLGHKFHALAEGLTLRSGDWWFFLLLYIDIILGFLATSHIPNEITWYDNLLGAHILVAEVLIATLPYTRGFHMFEFYLGKVREWYFMTYRRNEK
ncbi:hypothetical protein DFR86_04030 [Acidianus sulfidivorans JP7]|uniref:Uncharacterized protein n=1 Tax=Acidianus sulfidivorans JP7 TaxID=619593 RepID=A0A2U9ILA8_9CREN|nr:hypothetical protein [Acidianus sulfidivorans]AWR96806.1 hypothetical protein DFR86_04030 [Acidianus sulfidivorans JP7]